MKNTKTLLPLMLLFCSLYIACDKDDLTSTGGSRQVRIQFAGRVIDENGYGLIDVQVGAQNELATTDENGIFIMSPVVQNSRNALLFVKHQQYFDFSRAFFVQENIMQAPHIQLIEKKKAGAVNASSGGIIDIGGGAQVTFPANFASTANGSAYNGEVIVYARYLNPGRASVGDWRSGNDGAVLNSFGMMALQIETPDGEVLKPASGTEAEVVIPIRDDKTMLAPAEIPLWYYNTETARWVEDGSATRSDNVYKGKVKHFSFLNCGSSFEAVDLEGRLFLNSKLTPHINSVIRLSAESLGFEGYYAINQNGWFGAAVPKDAAIKMEVIMQGTCGETVVYTNNINASSGKITLPEDVFIPDSGHTRSVETRLIDCNSQAVSNGYVKVNWNGIETFSFGDANGNIRVPFLICGGGGNTANILAYDLKTGLQSEEQAFSIIPGSLVLGSMRICNEVVDYAYFFIDGQPVTLLYPKLSMVPVSTPSGMEFETEITGAPAMRMKFTSKNQTGTFPVSELGLDTYEQGNNTDDIFITVTKAPQKTGDLLIGSFGSNFKDASDNTHTFSGSFRITRS